MFTSDRVLLRGDDVLGAEVKGETILTRISTGGYYGLGVVGTVIWRLLDEPRRAGDLVAAVTGVFDVSVETASADLGAFLDDLLREGLVVLTGAPASASRAFASADWAVARSYEPPRLDRGSLRAAAGSNSSQDLATGAIGGPIRAVS